jgi:cytidylate kinase
MACVERLAGERQSQEDRMDDSAAITIISGCPGTGKTTLSRVLASTEPAGLHLITDTFYHFPAHPLDPTTPESHAQNTTIITAIGRAAAAFVEGGYKVFLDGVVGPWFLPTLLHEWDDGVRVDYVILQATLAEELARVLQRDGPATRARVCAMHEAFAKKVAGYARHCIDTTARSAEAVRAEFLRRRGGGEFLLDTRVVMP